MRIASLPLLLSPLLVVALVQPTTATAGDRSAARGAAPEAPTLVDVRAAHHDGVDRIVFEFEGGLPGHQIGYVRRLHADGSGRRVHVPGQAILRVRFRPARAHDDQGRPTAGPRRQAIALPNLVAAVRSGDFEADTTYGLGLARRARVSVSTLTSPSRVVLDIRAGFDTVQRKVFFLDAERFDVGREPYFRAVRRLVPAASPAAGVLDRLFAGPTRSEKSRGLRLVRSRAADYTDLEISDGVARVRLVPRCGSRGSTVTIAGEIMPTLRQFDSVRWVKIYDPRGRTQDLSPTGDSTPTCLEP